MPAAMRSPVSELESPKLNTAGTLKSTAEATERSKKRKTAARRTAMYLLPPPPLPRRCRVDKKRETFRDQRADLARMTIGWGRRGT